MDFAAWSPAVLLSLTGCCLLIGMLVVVVLVVVVLVAVVLVALRSLEVLNPREMCSKDAFVVPGANAEVWRAFLRLGTESAYNPQRRANQNCAVFARCPKSGRRLVASARTRGF
jgi:hypothetical protein